MGMMSINEEKECEDSGGPKSFGQRMDREKPRSNYVVRQAI